MRKAFTLAELLIALSVLSLIATFTIPKLLANTSQAQLNAILKEDISILSAITLEGVQDGSLINSTNLYDYFAKKMSYVKTCSSNSSNEGCWDVARQGSPTFFEHTESGFILSNGSVIAGINNFNLTPSGGNTYANSAVIDANGLNGPNEIGKDQICVTLLMGTGNTPCNDMVKCASGIIKYIPGQVGPAGIYEPQSVIFWKQLFQS